MLDVSEPPFSLVSLGEPLVGGAALAARGVPCSLFDDCQLMQERVELRIGVAVRFDRCEDWIDGGRRRRGCRKWG